LTITYRLKNNINIGALRRKFDYHRICCIINSPHSKEEETNIDDFKHVKFADCSYQLSQEELISWLKLYGIVEGEQFKVEESGKKYGNGKFMLKMRIQRALQELVLMQRQKIKINSQGIKKICKNCFAFHKEICKEQRRDWSEYVKAFMKNNPWILFSMINKDPLNPIKKKKRLL
jgi:hypothetical protein